MWRCSCVSLISLLKSLTGFWLEELAAPYYVFKDAGAQITLTSPNRS